MFEQIIARMLRAAQLDVDLYNEVEKDENATTEALIVVALTALCAAIGTALSGGSNLFSGIIGGIIGSLVGWLVSSATIVVATREALDVDTTKAIIISIIAFVIWMVVLTILGGIFGIGLAGLGVLSGAFQ